MKKLLSVLLIMLLALSITACTETEKEEIVLPPTRYGIYGGIVDYATFDAAEFFADADAVARVKVGNWLWEDCESQGNDYTYYQAQVLESYKGTVPENFTLVQNGSSQDTIYGPLLTYGNEMLLFLNKAAPGVFSF